jgi:glycosyltransferase involved in cell wall biosynthesis
MTAVGGFPEVGAGELVPPADAAALHDALRRLLADPAARERLAATSRAAAAGPYSWERAAEATLAVYRRLVSSP